jgi:drug/metabolite transporter (DMT)-like permease
MGILLAYLFFFVAASASPLQRRQLSLRRENDAGQVDFAFRVMFITFLLSAILIFVKNPEFNQSKTTIALLAAVCGIFGAIGIGSQYIAQRHVEAGLTSLISNVYTPVTIILATVLLNESLKPLQVLGTLLLLSSVILVSSKHRISKWRFDKYFWLMILSGVALGFVLTAERSLIKENGITTGTWASWGAQTLCLGLAALIIGRKSQYNFKDTSITGSLRFLQQLSWVILITVVANLSVVASVTTFKIVVVFVAAAVFLHEREDMKRKIIGSLIAVAGLLLMA